MSRKSSFSYEVKLKAVKQYISGEASLTSIAKALELARLHCANGYMHLKIKY